MRDLVFNVQDNHLLVRLRRDKEELQDTVKWQGLCWGLSTEQTFMMEWTTILPALTSSEAHALVKIIGSRFPMSPAYEKLASVCPSLVFRDTEPEWVFYGGSFNPWHDGHQACLNLLPEEKTCFVIPDRNPFKEILAIDPVITVLELSNRIQYKRHQYLTPTFLLNGKKNPTVDWIEATRRRCPERKLSLLLGFDSFRNIETWTRSEDLLEKIHKIYVVSRLEDDEEREHEFGRFQARNAVELEFLGRHEFEAISSTALRSYP